MLIDTWILYHPDLVDAVCDLLFFFFRYLWTDAFGVLNYVTLAQAFVTSTTSTSFIFVEAHVVVIATHPKS